MTNLKYEIISSCEICGGSGILDDYNCECVNKFRAYNRMINGGFKKSMLDFVSCDAYNIPYCSNGNNFLSYYIENPHSVFNDGLSLYIYSGEKGRGKTTLSHYIVYILCKFMSDTMNYNRKRKYKFEHIEDFIEKNKDQDYCSWKDTILVIDDIGNEDRSSSWKREYTLSFLQRVMHYRRDNLLPTIITSNYSPNGISTLYSGMLDSLLEINFNVINGMLFRQVELDGSEDLRIAQSFNKWPDM